MCIHRDDLENSGFDTIWIEIRVDYRRILLGNNYRTRVISKQECMKFMDNMTYTIIGTTEGYPDSIVMLGDLNDRCVTWDNNLICSYLGRKPVDLLNMS